MANESDLKYDGNQFLFADHATDFGAAPNTAANSLIIGTPTDVQMDLGALANSAAWQSAKFDFGDPRASMYRCDACIVTASAATLSATFDLYIAFSPSATVGTGNSGNTTGVDGTYTATAGSKSQMSYIGALACRAATTNIGYVGRVTPEHRYGNLVLINSSGQAVETTADDTHITLTPIAFVPGV
jgi:hypothetical protein